VRLFVSHLYSLIYLNIIIMFCSEALACNFDVDNDRGYPDPLVQLLLMCFVSEKGITVTRFIPFASVALRNTVIC